VLCFIVSTDLCLDVTTTTLFLLNTTLHYFGPSGMHANADSRSFVIEVLHNNLVYRRLVDAGFFWGGGGGEMGRCCHTRVFICEQNCSCLLSYDAIWICFLSILV